MPAVVVVLLCATIARAEAISEIAARWERWSLDFDSSTAARVERPEHRVRGESGQAFRSGARGGGAQLSLAAIGRIDLTSPGALQFSVAPEGWRTAPTGDYIPFVAVHGLEGSYFVVERDRPAVGRPGGRLLAGFWGLRGKFDVSLAVPLTVAWKPLEWHTIEVSWDATGFGVAVDGDAPVWKSVPPGIVAESFAPAAARIVIGAPGSETTRIDSIRVLSRAISSPSAR